MVEAWRCGGVEVWGCGDVEMWRLVVNVEGVGGLMGLHRAGNQVERCHDGLLLPPHHQHHHHPQNTAYASSNLHSTVLRVHFCTCLLSG